MNEGSAVRYRRFLAFAFAGLFFAGFGAARLAVAAGRAGMRPAFSTWRTQ